MADLTSSYPSDDVSHKTNPHKPGRHRVIWRNTHN